MLVYRLLFSLAVPFLVLALLWRVLRGKESWRDFRERMGAPGPAGPVIWIHGASNGELTAARPLVEALQSQQPEGKLLITCNTVTAKAMVRSWNIPTLQVRLAPLDLRWMLKSMLRQSQLQLFVLLEADFWPNRLAVAGDLAPCALVGGRISERSAAGWAKRPALANAVFTRFSRIIPQDDASGSRLAQLGAREAAMAGAFALKSIIATQENLPAYDQRKGTWLAASTHEGEDEILLRAHRIARQTLPELRMILAPRHARGAAIAKSAQQLGLRAVLRSEGHPADAPCDVYIADTLGEMEAWYSRAGICFVAGSLVPKGGHTPYEPASFGCAILHGHHLENFTAPYAALQAKGGSIQASTAEDIAKAICTFQDRQTAEKMIEAANGALHNTHNIGNLAQMLADLANDR